MLPTPLCRPRLLQSQSEGQQFLQVAEDRNLDYPQHLSFSQTPSSPRNDVGFASRIGPLLISAPATTQVPNIVISTSTGLFPPSLLSLQHPHRAYEHPTLGTSLCLQPSMAPTSLLVKAPQGPARPVPVTHCPHHLPPPPHSLCCSHMGLFAVQPTCQAPSCPRAFAHLFPLPATLILKHSLRSPLPSCLSLR